MGNSMYTEAEIRAAEFEGNACVCEYELVVGSDPSRYVHTPVEGSKAYFLDDEDGAAEEKLLDHIREMQRWFGEGHEGLDLADGEWLEYHIRRYNGFEGRIDFDNPFGSFSARFDDFR